MGYQIVRCILWVYYKFIHRAEVIGIENIPQNESFMLCSNHKSNCDPLFVASQFKRPIHWMAKQELFKNPILGKIITYFKAFPVNRGESDIAAVKTSLRILKDGEILGVFPEGTRVKEPDVNLGKSGVAVIAHKAKVKILPVYIEGSYGLFKKLKLYIRKPIDLSNLPKQSQLEYKEHTVDILKSIYYGVDIYKNNSCR